MRINLILIGICTMISITSCCQNSTLATENKALSKNILNEKWYNNENEDLDLPIDTTLHWYNQMHNGTDCYFYQDSTFKIRIWGYGVSSGLHASLISGRYQYNSDTREIVLAFDEEAKQKVTYSNEKPYPVAYFTMEGLKIKRPLHSNYAAKIPKLSKSCLKIIEETGNKIRVDLYAFNEKGKRISFGQQTFRRENVDNDIDR